MSLPANEVPTSEEYELGYFGNVWIKQHLALTPGVSSFDHAHPFDHVTLLARGKVEVKVKGYEPKVFIAPTFIVIKKEHRHTITALEADSVWYCIHAVRGEETVIGDLYAAKNNPLGGGSEDYETVSEKI